MNSLHLNMNCKYEDSPAPPLPEIEPSSTSFADALIYEILCCFAVPLIFASVFSPTPLVGFEIDLSKAGLSE